LANELYNNIKSVFLATAESQCTVDLYDGSRPCNCWSRVVQGLAPTSSL